MVVQALVVCMTYVELGAGSTSELDMLLQSIDHSVVALFVGNIEGGVVAGILWSGGDRSNKTASQLVVDKQHTRE
jgi:uncharacterized SAM-dependent methyltransferase